MKYRFVTIWRIEAPIEAVCEVIYNSLNWPQWWSNVVRVDELLPGDAQGIGSVRRYSWRGRLPYRLTFDINVIHIVPLAAIEGIASSDVEGDGLWSFSTEGAVTVVRFEWQVHPTPVWMNLLGADLHARRLQSVLTVYRSRELGIYAVYPSRKYLSATVRTFFDFLVERFGPNPDWGDWRQQWIHPMSRGVKNPPALLGLDYSALMR